MIEPQFRQFLKKGGRSQSAINRCVTCVKHLQGFLNEYRDGKSLGDVTPEDIKIFAEWADDAMKPPFKTKILLWGIIYYYEFTEKKDVRKTAAEQRQARIQRRPFLIRDFRGINLKHADKLEAEGIKSFKDMLDAGSTKDQRKALSKKTGVPLKAILEFVKLSDLARLGGVKAIRARLYYDAGVDTIEKMAQWDPVELRAMLIDFIEKTGFDGIASLPKEAENAVKDAKKLPKIVEY